MSGRQGDGLTAISAAASHVGSVRKLNEDAAFRSDEGQLWAVADGMGGHSRGDYASKCVVDFLGRVRPSWPAAKSLAYDIEHRLKEANEHLLEEAQKIGGDSIGSTVVCLAKLQEYALVAWAGDSRIYLLRGSFPLTQINRDHTIVQDLIDAGRLAEADAEEHPMASHITRAVGAQDTIELDFTQFKLLRGDRLVLCSDGLTRTLSNQTIEGILRAHLDLDQTCAALVDETLRKGAPDNITVVVVDIL